MKSTALAAAAAALLLIFSGASRAFAVTELDVVVEIHFLDSCEETDGFWTTWDATVDPEKEQVFDPDYQVPLSWAPGSSFIRPETDQVTGITYEVAGSPPWNEFWFVLLAADRETILFEHPFDLASPALNPYWQIRAWLDCSTIPYREVAAPDTAMSRTPGFPWIGAALIATGGLLAARLRTRRKLA